MLNLSPSFSFFPFGLFYTSLAVASLSLFHIPYSLPTLYAPRDQLLLFRPLDSSFWKVHGLFRLYRRSFRRKIAVVTHRALLRFLRIFSLKNLSSYAYKRCRCSFVYTSSYLICIFHKLKVEKRVMIKSNILFITDYRNYRYNVISSLEKNLFTEIFLNQWNQ